MSRPKAFTSSDVDTEIVSRNVRYPNLERGLPSDFKVNEFKRSHFIFVSRRKICSGILLKQCLIPWKKEAKHFSIHTGKILARWKHIATKNRLPSRLPNCSGSSDVEACQTRNNKSLYLKRFLYPVRACGVGLSNRFKHWFPGAIPGKCETSHTWSRY